MSDDNYSGLSTAPPFSYTGPVPAFFTRSRYRPSSTLSTETQFPESPSSTLPTSFDVSSPTLTQTDDLPSSTDPSSNSEDPSIDPSTSIFSSDTSSPTSTPDFFTSTSSDGSSPTLYSSSDSNSWPTTDSSSYSTLTTSELPLTTSSPSPSPTPTPVLVSSSTTRPPNQVTSPLSQISLSSSSSVTTTTLPSIGGGGSQASPQSQSSSSPNTTGQIVAAVTGSIALAIILAVLAIMFKKRRMMALRGRGGPDPFLDLDLDGEMVAVNEPLIAGNGPAPGGAGYIEPFTDESGYRGQSRSPSVTTGPGTSLTRSNNSFQSVVAPPLPPLRGGWRADHYNQNQPTDRRSPPNLPPSAITRARSPSVQTRVSSDLHVPRQSSPSFDSGAVAYIRHNDQATDANPQFSPRSTEDHRLTSAFSAASGLSPRHSNPVPPPNVDENWRNSPDPVSASLSYRPTFDRRRSFKPSVSGHISETGDITVISPVDVPIQGSIPSLISTGSYQQSYMSGQHNYRGGNYGSRPSPITEVTEVPSHSQEGSSNSGGTWDSNQSSSSLPVVMEAQRVRLTPTALSLVSQPGLSTPSHYGDSSASLVPPNPNQFSLVPPVPTLPQVQPLSLGKKRSVLGAS